MSARESATEAARALGDLTTKTPVEIDTVLAELDGEIYQRNAGLDSLAGWLHALAGHEQDRYGLWRSGERIVSDQEVIGQARDDCLPANPEDVRPVLATMAAVSEKLAAATEQFDRIDVEYQSRPWNRYVTVPGGHVHSGIWCAGGTIRPRTLRAWTPELAGSSIEQAIAELATTMCTHCFPSAPVVDTLTAQGYCAGSGGNYAPDKPKRTGFCTGNWGTCPDCGGRETLTRYGYLRKHKAPSNEAPKAKPGQPANADGSPVYVAKRVWNTGTITDEGNALKTMVAVNRAAVSAAKDLHWYSPAHPDAPAWVETLNRMVPLLAADKGITEEEVRAELTKKARKQ